MTAWSLHNSDHLAKKPGQYTVLHTELSGMGIDTLSLQKTQLLRLAEQNDQLTTLELRRGLTLPLAVFQVTSQYRDRALQFV